MAKKIVEGAVKIFDTVKISPELSF